MTAYKFVKGDPSVFEGAPAWSLIAYKKPTNPTIYFTDGFAKGDCMWNSLSKGYRIRDCDETTVEREIIAIREPLLKLPEGYVQWFGGKSPIKSLGLKNEDAIEIIFRNGDQSKIKSTGDQSKIKSPMDLDYDDIWEHRYRDLDIVAYRVFRAIPDTPQEKPERELWSGFGTPAVGEWVAHVNLSKESQVLWSGDEHVLLRRPDGSPLLARLSWIKPIPVITPKQELTSVVAEAVKSLEPRLGSLTWETFPQVVAEALFKAGVRVVKKDD